MTPATAAAMRAALEARIVSQSSTGGLEPGRLRRRLVFQRVLRRLPDDDRWVLKGGYLLEARLAAGARTTRDLDLASAQAGDLETLRDVLEGALSVDPDGDFLQFQIGAATRLGLNQAGQGGWRFSLVVTLAGRAFDKIRIDIVERVAETSGAPGSRIWWTSCCSPMLACCPIPDWAIGYARCSSVVMGEIHHRAYPIRPPPGNVTKPH